MVLGSIDGILESDKGFDGSPKGLEPCASYSTTRQNISNAARP